MSEVIPADGKMVVSATAFFEDSETGLYLNLTLGGVGSPPFDTKTPWKSFVLMPFCRMDLRTMFDSYGGPPTEEEVAQLGFPRKIYRIAKELFMLTDAERCAGVDERFFTGELWSDPSAFQFSRSAAWEVNKYLE
jgi:hypothetical protein